MLFHHFSEFFARSYPDSPCLTLGETTLDTKTFNEAANRLANGMLSLGFQPGQSVAILGENSIEHAVSLVAASKTGALLVPLNYRLAPAELAYIISDSKAKLLIVLESAQDQLAPLKEHLSADVTVLSASADDTLHWDDWTSEFDSTAPYVESDRDAPLLQLYTSGTTGNPKGVVISHYNVLNTSLMNNLQRGYRPNIGSAEVLIAPMFHIGGIGSLIAGLINCQQTIIHETFDPVKLLDDIEAYPVEHVFMVPAMIQFLLQVPGIEDRDFSRIIQISYGASPISEALLKDAIKVFECDFAQLYGMTETTGFGVMLVQNDHTRALGSQPGVLRSCGRPSIGAAIRVVNTQGREVGQGEIGEIWLKSDSNMLHYYNLEEETASNLTDGWVHTGDAGYIDEEGYLYLKDRIKDMVVSGGENIYPTEVENVLVTHPSIADVAVIGVPDDKFGEALLAFVVLAPETTLTVDELIEFCRNKIADYKIPRQLKLIEALPRNPSGKLLKKELREPYWQDSDRRIG